MEVKGNLPLDDSNMRVTTAHYSPPPIVCSQEFQSLIVQDSGQVLQHAFHLDDDILRINDKSKTSLKTILMDQESKVWNLHKNQPSKKQGSPKTIARQKFRHVSIINEK
ncbi:unnamed protein product [Citrullus colocynthis]|uniref:Uncharacterized protein n=1 Tax=Citrullus colocynthis TaxID=252529 RepID=A0ABP0XP40_9ROSI